MPYKVCFSDLCFTLFKPVWFTWNYLGGENGKQCITMTLTGTGEGNHNLSFSDTR